MSPHLRVMLVIALSALILLAVHSRVDWAGWMFGGGGSKIPHHCGEA